MDTCSVGMDACDVTDRIPVAPVLPQTALDEPRKPPQELESVFLNMQKSINNLRKSPWVLSRSSEYQHRLFTICAR
jgi:hypothetical protein